jgi:putative holliday junction resolvase
MNEFPGRLLCIDHGLKFLGLATSDRIGMLATPFRVIKRKSRHEDFAKLQAIITEEAIAAIILGLPPRPHDFVGTSQSDLVRNWAKRLYHVVDVPIYFWDEGMSSADAEDELREMGKRIPDRIDNYAAAVILRQFLDAMRAGQSWPAPFTPNDNDSSHPEKP